MFRKINCLFVGILLGIACQFGGLHAAEANGPHWIWYPAYRPLPNSFVFFRKELTVDSAIVSAKRSRPTAATGCMSTANSIQRGPAPFDPRFQEFDPVDLAANLTRGVNCIGILVCYWGEHGEGTYVPGKPGLQFNLTVKTADGEKKIVSDSSWRTQLASCWTPGEHRRDYLRALQEVFNPGVSCRLELPRLQGFNLDSREGVESRSGIAFDSLRRLFGHDGLLSLGPNIYDSPQAFEMRSRTIPFLNEQRHSCVNLSAEGRLHWKVPPEEYFDSFTENAFTAEIKARTRRATMDQSSR